MRKLACVLLALSSTGLCAESFTVSDIRIEGLQRLSPGTVFGALPLNVGDEVDDEDIVKATRALFKSGFFEDIQIGRDSEVLVVNVTERPSIGAINLEGNKSIPTEGLLEGLKQQGLSVGRVFKRSALEGVQNELQRVYVSQGRYSASISTVIDELPRNRVALTIYVEEGSVANIADINIIGNKVYDDEDLLDLFLLRKSNLWSFYKNDDKYAREKLSGDLERLRSFYLNNGYIKFAIESTQVSISPDKSSVYITVNISEGAQYTIGDVKLAGDVIVDESEIKDRLLVKEGQVFSRELMTQSSKLILNRLSKEGYTFADVNGVPEPVDGQEKVNITFLVDPRKRVYVRRINFKGNTKTADEVLRREMRQMEGAWASGDKIESSKRRLDRLGYFKTVNVKNVPVEGTDDQVDVEFSVEEQASGSLNGSFGFSQANGVILAASVSQDNFLGTGNKVSVGVSRSNFRTSLSYDYLNPYYTLDGVSRGFRVFYQQTDFDDADFSDFATDSYGANINFGYPMGENQRLNFGFGLEQTEIEEGGEAPIEIQEFLKQEGDEFLNLKLEGSWVYSTLNRKLFPTDGSQQVLRAEVAVPGSELEFFKIDYKADTYYPISPGWTVHARGRVGYLDAYGDTNVQPFFENFRAGGIGSVRGFREGSLGPRDTAANLDLEGDPFGGNILLEGSLELIVPTPFVEEQGKFRTLVFFDAGNVFDTNRDQLIPEQGLGDNADDQAADLLARQQIADDADLDFGEIRYSVGVGFTWLSPIGPISASLAKALNAEEDDDDEVFQFSLGKTF